jgi:hypothetical protein
VTDDLFKIRYPRLDVRLGRNVVHDPRSRAFPRAAAVDRSTWRDKAVRIYDPLPNPNQPVGCCTGVDASVKLNAIGNRVKGRVLGMDIALKVYSRATQLDPWMGSYPPEDTGSSGLAAAKAAVEFGLATEYRWLFRGADEVVQTIMEGEPVGIGARWEWDMFEQDANGVIHLGGGLAGGHQWTARGYDVDRDLILGRCWWGSFRDFWISRADLAILLADNGDAHVLRSV